MGALQPVRGRTPGSWGVNAASMGKADWLLLLVGCPLVHACAPDFGCFYDITQCPEIPPDSRWTSTPLAMSRPGDTEPTVGCADKELWFNSNRSGANGIWVSTRGSALEAWEDPVVVPAFDALTGPRGPDIAADGLELHLVGDAGPGFKNFFRVIRSECGTPWSAATRIDELSSDVWDDSPSVRQDGLLVVLISARPTGSIRDLYMARRDSVLDPWEDPVPLSALNDPDDRLTIEATPFITQDGAALYFASDRTGDMDLYRAEWNEDGDTFVDPEPVPGLSETGVDEVGPWVHPSSRWMLLSINDGTGPVLHEARR